jgi:hypothetical protein
MDCLFDQQDLLFLIILVLLSLICYIFVWHGKGKPGKHLKWKNESIKTNLASVNFVYLIKDICLHKGFLLLEISPTHAYLKMNPSMSHWGAYFYIELDEDKQTATVWGRGPLSQANFRLIWITDLVNLMYVA